MCPEAAELSVCHLGLFFWTSFLYLSWYTSPSFAALFSALSLVYSVDMRGNGCVEVLNQAENDCKSKGQTRSVF